MASEFDIQRREVAAKSLAKKLRLESSIENRFNRLFREISREFKTVFSNSGSVIRADIFSEDIRYLLATHYRTVISEFKGDIIRTTKAKNYPIQIKQVTQRLNDENARFVERQSKTSEGNITTTNQSQLDTAIAFALALLSDQGVEPTNEKIASVASNKFLSNSLSRSKFISITETQNSAEESKFNEMNFIISLGIVSRFSSRKVWTSMRDERVRDTHVIADGQIRKMDESFEVPSPSTGQIELLRHPGDSSQGASIENVINCRCSGSMAIKE
ncbi:MAG: hypothetical protein V3S42_04635 [Candidatus Neomarinimicrobiota bacterium]